MTSDEHRKTNGKDSGTFIKIMLVDDHAILRSGLRELIEKYSEYKIIAEAGDGREAVEMCQKFSLDIAIMDISMQELNGIEATRQILSNSPRTKVIVLSVHSGQRFVKEVFKAGASGYLVKDCVTNELISAIDSVVADRTYLCPQIATIVKDDYLRHILQTESDASSHLTPREREVLQLMAEGKSTKEIAFSLKLSTKTVETHRQRLMDKLDIHSVAELTKYAIREGLTPLECCQ